MPRKDKYHNSVCIALEKDEWIITDDPLTLQVGKREIYIDLGAEKAVIAAERGGEQIAVEIKSLIGKSYFVDYYQSLGQYLVYRLALKQAESNRILYLAVPSTAYDEFIEIDLFRDAWIEHSVHLLIFDEKENQILKWIQN
jgi:XisH protein